MTFGTLMRLSVPVGSVSMEDYRGQGEAGPSGHRKTLRAQTYSGAAILGLCLAIGVIMLAAGADPYVPVWLWILLFLGCLVTIFWAVGISTNRRVQLVLYAAAVLMSWAVMWLMPAQGTLSVLLIVVAATGSYVLSVKAVFGVVVLNCLAIMGHLWILGEEPAEYLAFTAFYLILHIAAVLSTYAQARESRVRAELEEKATELEAASVLLEDSAKTAERLRISRELHDLIGHQLTVLNLELEAAKHREGEQARAHTDQAAAVAKDLLADVRSTVGELRDAGPGDLRTALQRIASAVQSLEISIEVAPEVTVDEQQAQALLRAGQEIITNAVKHSEAYKLWITLEQDSPGVRLRGTNDGLSPRRVVPGHGLQGLRERVELLGGTLTLTPHPHFTVEVSLPPCAADEVSKGTQHSRADQLRADQSPADQAPADQSAGTL